MESQATMERWRASFASPVVECADDAGRWVSEALGLVDVTALLAFCVA